MGNAGYGNHTEDTAKDVASKRQAPQSGSDKQSGGKVPAAGPHDKPDLTDPNATPGTGALPEAGDHDATDSTSS